METFFGFYCMCADKYMYTMSEGAWKSVTYHVSRARQAGLALSLTTSHSVLTAYIMYLNIQVSCTCLSCRSTCTSTCCNLTKNCAQIFDCTQN